MAKKKSINPSKREEREARRRKQQQQKYIKWGVLGLLVLVVVGGFVWFGTRPVTAMGEGVVVTSRDHVAEGTTPGPFATNPPTGGKHYAGTYQPGFYEEDDLENLPKAHEGYLVHNLEHGYVIFWYNCAAIPDGNCDGLKQTIREVMDQAGTDEVIAFPWTSQSEPLVMTSWDRILRFDTATPDPERMRQFIRLYHNKAPEPDAS